MSTVYGYDVLLRDDRNVEMAETVFDMITRAAMPGAFLVNDLPLLRFIPKWFPGGHFKHIAIGSQLFGSHSEYNYLLQIFIEYNLIQHHVHKSTSR